MLAFFGTEVLLAAALLFSDKAVGFKPTPQTANVFLSEKFDVGKFSSVFPTAFSAEVVFENGKRLGLRGDTFDKGTYPFYAAPVEPRELLLYNSSVVGQYLGGEDRPYAYVSDTDNAFMLGDNDELSQSFFVYFKDAKTWQLAYRKGVLNPEKPDESSIYWQACGPFEKEGQKGLYQMYHGWTTGSKGGCERVTIEMSSIALDPTLGRFPWEFTVR
ncbi:hypothetical protein NA57DRAFT_60965 [Rhizodiscina lignyota]|uniref:Uncharacterized protein n=1 Tax=Rhizodiscina lignyota TaxID=1504668 RepID=A0A9P4M1R3_9PEZI|nr:hypothetical protein NA57DRAFT_60965 [Rhizodiscina lignyota]